MPLTFLRDPEVRHGVMEAVSPMVRRIVAPNPGPFTYTGTGVYVVGHGDVAVIDPGPATEVHVDALVTALAGERVTHVLVTHTHADHSPAAAILHELTGAPRFGFGPHPDDPGDLDETPEESSATDHVEEPYDRAFAPDVTVRDGDVIEGAGWTLECIHTPGHLANHVCYRLTDERTLFTGDHVMGWSTSVIAPPGGDLDQYLASLRRLLDLDDTWYRPTHGPAVPDPHPYVRALIEHREERTRQILARLAAGDTRIPDIVAALYAEVDQKLHKAAGRSVLAHLLALRAAGVVTCEEPRPGVRATWHLS